MASQKIVFRADGNSEIGMGHITRSLALAEMLKDHFDCYFATRYISESVRKDILSICKELIELPKDHHESYFLDLLKGEETVVLDNYFFKKKFRQKIQANGCKIVCIDDLGGDFTYCDLIINHSPIAKKNDYIVDSQTQLLLGLDYVLLRSPFLNMAKQPVSFDSRKYSKIFICFGGSDYLNLTKKIIENINNIKKFEQINVVVGNEYAHFDHLKTYVDNFENITSYFWFIYNKPSKFYKYDYAIHKIWRKHMIQKNIISVSLSQIKDSDVPYYNNPLESLKKMCQGWTNISLGHYKPEIKWE